jgi:hypothetical protein
MKSLDFMIVGVQKGGTTALAHFLAQHPQVAMAQGKEVHLFDAPDYQFEWTREQINQRYSDYFSHSSKSCLLGEATPIYCYWSEIAPELYRYNPDLKLIILLRDPVERAISQYTMECARGDETLPFWLALLLEPYRLWRDKSRRHGSARRCHSYCSRGHYSRQLANLRRYFPDQKLLVIDNSELLAEHEKTLQKVCRFLGISEENLPAPERVFSGNYVRAANPLLRCLLRVYFHIANRSLRNQLNAMGYFPNWSWLR